ncbi:hypothetical protein HPP92_027959 [Vanilla planifolia]|uniref:Secreted protein n=1 Tax=Vanilla planifolia TaxID=51239 RepID=A0A835U479_VANPL|nr:hypothetical protein HPP92_027959 [Vanilla planifolia]
MMTFAYLWQNKSRARATLVFLKLSTMVNSATAENINIYSRFGVPLVRLLSRVPIEKKYSSVVAVLLMVASAVWRLRGTRGGVRYSSCGEFLLKRCTKGVVFV